MEVIPWFMFPTSGNRPTKKKLFLGECHFRPAHFRCHHHGTRGKWFYSTQLASWIGSKERLMWFMGKLIIPRKNLGNPDFQISLLNTQDKVLNIWKGQTKLLQLWLVRSPCSFCKSLSYVLWEMVNCSGKGFKHHEWSSRFQCNNHLGSNAFPKASKSCAEENSNR